MDKEHKVAEEFHRIYRHEWKEARDALSSEKQEEEIIYLLMRIVRGIYDMCTEDAWLAHHKHSSDHTVGEFIKDRLPKALNHGHVTNPVRAFIHVCIKSISAMTGLKHPLGIFWQPKGDVIDSEKFDLASKETTGQIVDWTAWPAVVREDGSLVSKGVVIPIV